MANCITLGLRQKNLLLLQIQVNNELLHGDDKQSEHIHFLLYKFCRNGLKRNWYGKTNTDGEFLSFCQCWPVSVSQFSKTCCFMHNECLSNFVYTCTPTWLAICIQFISHCREYAKASYEDGHSQFKTQVIAIRFQII